MTDDRKTRELAELLPWYANGTLPEKDRKRVETALKRDADLRAQLELVREDRQAAVALAEEVPLPASLQSRFTASLNAEIERNAKAADQRSADASPGWIARFAQFMTPPRLAIATAAAAAVIAIQAAVLVTGIMETGRGSQYQTATGGEPGKAGTITFLVKLKADATAGALSQFLAANGGRIVDGPGQSGLYRIAFAEDGDAASIKATLDQATGLFEIVLPGSQ